MKIMVVKMILHSYKDPQELEGLPSRIDMGPGVGWADLGCAQGGAEPGNIHGAKNESGEGISYSPRGRGTRFGLLSVDVGNNPHHIQSKDGSGARETCSQKQRSERVKLDVWPQEGTKEVEMQSWELWRGSSVTGPGPVPRFQEPRGIL